MWSVMGTLVPVVSVVSIVSDVSVLKNLPVQDRVVTLSAAKGLSRWADPSLRSG
jgi:hypothetical protein